jgi:dTDP-4-amino-4,6-dideoxygalactose transaminase
MQVPLLDLKRQWKTIREEALAHVLDVLDTQMCVLGPRVAGFETAIADYCNAKHAVGCASGTDAILLGLRSLGVGAGEEVITTPYSFFATAGAIVNAKGRPVFVDVDPVSFNIDPAQIEAAVTPNSRVIEPVHIFGQCADMDPLLAVAEKHGLGVLEDAAQAIGAEDKGRRAGSMGNIGTFSFYPSKNLGGVGDGGMMTTNDDDCAADLRSLRAHGGALKFVHEQSDAHGGARRYVHQQVGWNSRLDALQVAVLEVKLPLLEGWTEARRAHARYYDEALAGIDGLRTPKELPGKRHIYNQYTVLADRRDDLKAFLGEKGIGAAIYYPRPLHLQECFTDLGYKRGRLPVSERLCEENLSIPVFPEMTEAERDHVATCIREFYGA